MLSDDLSPPRRCKEEEGRRKRSVEKEKYARRGVWRRGIELRIPGSEDGSESGLREKGRKKRNRRE